MLYLAIDQHAKQLTVNLRNEEGHMVLPHRQVSTRWEKVRAFFAWLAGEAAPHGGYVVILEVCGFNDWLLKLLRSCAGCREIVVIQPHKSSRRKTDRRDAQALGHLLWVHRHLLLGGGRVIGLRRVELPSEEDAAARQLTALRMRLGQQRTRTLHQINHLLLKHNLQQECPTKGRCTKAARRWLETLSLPPIDRLEMNLLLVQWRQWDEQLAQVEQQINEVKATHRAAALIGSIPGLRGYGGLAIACRVGNKDRFPRPGSLANYWGLTPGTDSSGERQRIGAITKEGSSLVRFLLGQAVLHVLRADAHLRAWYCRVKARRGSKIARVGVMRRIATTIWHLLKHQEPYRAGGSPQRKGGVAKRSRKAGVAEPSPRKAGGAKRSQKTTVISN